MKSLVCDCNAVMTVMGKTKSGQAWEFYCIDCKKTKYQKIEEADGESASPKTKTLAGWVANV